MRFASEPADHRQNAAYDRHRAIWPPAQPKQHGQLVQVVRYITMLGPEGRLVDRQRLSEERFGSGIVAALPDNYREIAKVRADLDVVLA